MARLLWSGPQWLRAVLALLGWQLMRDSWIDAPATYRFQRIDDPWIHGGVWRYRWETRPGVYGRIAS